VLGSWAVSVACGNRDVLPHHAPRSFVFWLGDLNYRIRMDNDLARQLIRDKNYVKLRCEDQVH
jgi:hypothetical protein